MQTASSVLISLGGKTRLIKRQSLNNNHVILSVRHVIRNEVRDLQILAHCPITQEIPRYTRDDVGVRDDLGSQEITIAKNKFTRQQFFIYNAIYL